MTEKQFWEFMEKAWAKARVSQLSGTMDSDDPGIERTGAYLSGHALLPQDYDRTPKEIIAGMANLLFQDEVTNKAKEAILIILAHQSSKPALNVLKEYCLKPDKGLECFADMALSECEMWNE